VTEESPATASGKALSSRRSALPTRTRGLSSRPVEQGRAIAYRAPLSSRRRKLLKFGVIGGAIGLVALQAFPAGKLGVHVEDIGVSPSVRFTIDAPSAVLAILRRACWDCHTNETKWPFYARLAPFSWLLAYDIHNARNHLNFSKWADADQSERRTDRENCWEQIESGAMPRWYYVYPMHMTARLSDADKVLLDRWLMKDDAKKVGR